MGLGKDILAGGVLYEVRFGPDLYVDDGAARVGSVAGQVRYTLRSCDWWAICCRRHDASCCADGHATAKESQHHFILNARCILVVVIS